MPKFARPNSYNGKQSNKNWTGSTRAANLTEAAAGEAEQLYISPSTLAEVVDDLMPDATTTSKGKVELATLTELQNGSAPAGAWVPTSNDVATVIAGIVVGAVPPATETQAGILEVATQAESDAGLLDNKIITPVKMATSIGNGSFAGSFTSLDASGAVTFSSTGAISMTSDTASTLAVTGAGIDLTLDSDAGRLVLTGGEAAADAVRIQADNVGGGIDVDAGTLGVTVDTTGAISLDSATASNFTVTGAADLSLISSAGSINITAGENAADAIVLTSSAGGIDILATGSAGEDIDIVNTGGSVNITATEDVSNAIYIRANAGTSETVKIHADQGTSATSLDLLSDVGGITLTAGAANADAINIVTSNASGGIDIDSGTNGIIADTTGKFTFTSTTNAAQAFYLHANGGTSETIQLHADQGTGVASLNFLSDVGGVTISAGLGTADAINIITSNAAGGIDIDAGTSGIDILTTGALSIDSAGTTNLTATGAFGLTVNTTAGQLNLASGQAAVDAVNIDASDLAGGIDIDSGTGGLTLDTTGAMSLDAAATSNYTVTGVGADLNLGSVGGSVLVSSTEDAALAIRLHADGGTSETIQIHSDQGTGVASVGLLSDVGGITIRSTGLASADAINLEAAAGGIDADAALQINIASSQAAATAVQITASDAGAGGITLTAGSGGVNVTGATVVTGALTTSGDLTLSSVATKITMNGGAVTDFIGRATLVGGTVTVANTNIAATDRIFVTRSALNASPALGFPITSISAGASFTIASFSSTGAAAATDVSTFDYVIIRQS